MRKPILLTALMLAVAAATAVFAQPGPATSPKYLGRKTTAQQPATCTADVPQYYYNTDDNEFRYCSATNTWTAMGGSSGITVGTTTSDGTADTLLKTNSTGKVVDATGLTNTSTNQLTITSQAATNIPLTVTGAGSQSGNLAEFKDSSGNVGVFIAPVNTGGVDGGVYLGAAGSGSGVQYLSSSGIRLLNSFNTVLQGSWNGAWQYFANNGEGMSMAPPKTVTDGSAVTIGTVALPTLQASSGVLHVRIFATDGTDVQVRTQIVRWEAVNKGGVYTTNISVVSEGAAVSAGTLTAAWSITTGSDVINIRVTADTSLASTTTFTATWIADSQPLFTPS